MCDQLITESNNFGHTSKPTKAIQNLTLQHKKQEITVYFQQLHRKLSKVKKSSYHLQAIELVFLIVMLTEQDCAAIGAAPKLKVTTDLV